MEPARFCCLISLLVVLLPGCRGSSEPVSEIEFWAMGSEGEQVQPLLAGFSERFPGTTVRVQQLPWSAAHEKLLTAFVAGTLPDVVQVGNTWIPELAAIGAIAPLDETLRDSATVADFFPGVLATNAVDGRLYGVPWYVDTRVMFYRRDLLSRAGYDSAPTTWSDWVEAMTRIRAQAASDRFALFVPLSEWQLPVVLAFQSGAELLRDRDRYGNFRSPEFRRGFSFYVDLFRRGLAPFAGDAQISNVYQDFAAGLFAFYVSGPWNLGEMQRRLPAALDTAWTTAPLPGPDDAHPGVSIAGGASLCVVRGSRRAAQAWRLVAYLSEPAQQVAFYKSTGDLPSRRTAWDDPSLRANARAQAFRQQLQHVRATPPIPEWERIAALITRYGESAVRGDISIDAALTRLDTETDAVLEKRRWMMERNARRPSPVEEQPK